MSFKELFIMGALPNSIGEEICLSLIEKQLFSSMIIHQRDTIALTRLIETLQSKTIITTITGHSSPIKTEQLDSYASVLCISLSSEFLGKASNFCHSRGIPFICVDVKGVFVNFFCDFYGWYDEFVEKESIEIFRERIQIESISNTNPTLITCREDILFTEDQKITIRESEIPQLNDSNFSFIFEKSNSYSENSNNNNDKKNSGEKKLKKNKIIIPFDASLFSEPILSKTGVVTRSIPNRSKSIYLTMEGFFQLKKSNITYPQFHQLFLGFNALYQLKKRLENAQISIEDKREEFWEIVEELNKDERYKVQQIYPEMLQFLFQSAHSTETLDIKSGNFIANKIAYVFKNFTKLSENEQWSFYDLAGSLLYNLNTQIYPRYGSLLPHNLNLAPKQIFSKIFQDHLIYSIDKSHEMVSLFSEILETISCCYITKTTTTCDFRYIPEGFEEQFFLVDRLNEQMFYDLSQVFDTESMALEWKRQIDNERRVVVCLTFRPLFSTAPISKENVNSLGLLIRKFIENTNNTLNLCEHFRLVIESIPFLFNETVSNFIGLGAVRYIPEYFAEQPEEDVKKGVNQLNQLLAFKLSQNNDIFFPALNVDQQNCICIGTTNFPLSHQEVTNLAKEINAVATQIELESKSGNLSELIIEGIQNVQQSLEREDEERNEQESLVRKIPVVGSFVNWWTGTPEKQIVPKGKTFNLASQNPSSFSSLNHPTPLSYSPLKFPPEKTKEEDK